MKKTMYSAMKNLAEYIAASQSSDFDGIWMNGAANINRKIIWNYRLGKWECSYVK